MGGLDSFGGGLDELSHVIWVRDHRHVAGLNGINVGREVVDEVVLRPGEALLVDVEMGQRGVGGPPWASRPPIDSPSSRPKAAM